MEGIKVLALSLLASFSNAESMCEKVKVQDVQATSNVLTILLSVDNLKSTKNEVVKK